MYDWEGKQEESYRLYYDENKTLEQVAEVWALRGFTPSKRAWQTQFKRWNFPSKQRAAHRDPALITRVQELWENNVMQKDMLETLNQEGFKISDRELMRVRHRYKWHLRESRKGKNPNAKRTKTGQFKGKSQKSRDGNIIDQMGNAILNPEEPSTSESESDAEGEEDSEHQTEPEASPELPLDPEEQRQREERLLQMKAESDERWRARKRRRRTRGWAGLPPDDPSEPPRFPSETTLDESKVYLGLDNALYRQVREHFQRICEAEGVIKKTVAGPEKWAEVKHRLVRENAHLATVFRNDMEAQQEIGRMPTPINKKALALDVICLDVTKRIRTMGTRMGIPEAKAALGFNPEHTRIVRSAFYAKLKADRFPNRLQAGNERWNRLKQEWVVETELLSKNIEAGPADPNYEVKMKAIECLARDVMKRWRHDETKKDPSKKKQINVGPGPGPAPPLGTSHASNSTRVSIMNRTRATTSESQSGAPEQDTPIALQIDPSLLLAANDPSVMPTHHHHHQHPHPHQQAPPNNAYMMPSSFYPPTPSIPTHNPAQIPQPHTTAAPQHQHQPPLPTQIPPPSIPLPQTQTLSTVPAPIPIPAYFRLHAHSTPPTPGKRLWLSVLPSGTLSEVRALVLREHPGSILVKIEGLVVHRVAPGQQAREMMFTIDDEDELEGYLAHVREVAGGKVTFVVLLAGGAG